jgi:hypothetical protein
VVLGLCGSLCCSLEFSPSAKWVSHSSTHAFPIFEGPLSHAACYNIWKTIFNVFCLASYLFKIGVLDDKMQKIWHSPPLIIVTLYMFYDNRATVLSSINLNLSKRSLLLRRLFEDSDSFCQEPIPDTHPSYLHISHRKLTDGSQGENMAGCTTLKGFLQHPRKTRWILVPA